MSHRLLSDASFWSFLSCVDRDLAEQTRARGCPCGGPLHVANYPRKPRGGPDGLAEEHRWRLSFCCARDGCRKRATPPSARFLGPKVYLGAVVILASAMRQGPPQRGWHELRELFGADRRTLSRWQVFWREHFARSAFWKLARARLRPRFEVAMLPRALLHAFTSGADGEHSKWRRLLCFLSPITIRGGLERELSR